MNALYEGILLGLSLAFIFGYGPAFFALLQTGMHRGFLAGTLLAFGIFLNDLIIVVLGLLGSVHVIKGSENYQLMGTIGGILLIIFGLYTLIRSEADPKTKENNTPDPHALIYVGKGFLLNLMNPFVWIFWFTVIVSATASYQAKTFELTLFFAGTLGIVLITDITKVFMASRLSKVVTPGFLSIVNKIAGAALILFGIYMIVRGYINI